MCLQLAPLLFIIFGSLALNLLKEVKTRVFPVSLTYLEPNLSVPEVKRFPLPKTIKIEQCPVLHLVRDQSGVSQQTDLP